MQSESTQGWIPRLTLVHRWHSTRLCPASLAQAIDQGVDYAVERPEAAVDGGGVASKARATA